MIDHLQQPARRLSVNSMILTVLLILGMVQVAWAADSDVDATFSPGAGANGVIRSIALQPDGKIVIGGSFTTVSGAARAGVARLNSDGSLDTTFTVGAGVSGDVYTVAVQADGKILIGGEFTTVAGVTRNNLARLNANGSLDTAFDPNADLGVYTMIVEANGSIIIGGFFLQVGGLDRLNLARLDSTGVPDATFTDLVVVGNVYALARQADGKILVGGYFTDVVTNNENITRLNADGSADSSFSAASTGGNGIVGSIVLQADGKILIGGDFNQVNGVSHTRIARLNSDGTLDSGFSAGSGITGNNLSNDVLPMAVQSDGKIVVGGAFTTVNGVARANLARLNANGSVDTAYTANTNGIVWALVQQPPGKLLVGGDFGSVGGTATGKLARLNGTAGSAPTLTIPATPKDASNGTFSVPVNFTGNASNIASAGFSIDYDACLDYVDVTGLPTGFASEIRNDGADSDGELDISLFDNTVPINALSDGQLLTINFAVDPTCVTTDGSTRNVTIAFSNAPAPSFSNTTATDVDGTATGATITLSFNATPSAITLTPNSVDENVTVGTAVGTLSTTDLDSGDSHTYALVAGTNDNASFTLEGNTIKTATALNFETKNSYTLRLRTTDNGGLNGSFEQNVSVSINDRNEQPTALALNTTTIDEGAATGTAVGTLSTTDPDNGDAFGPDQSFAYTLVAGAGAADNTSFAINGTTLQSAAVFDFAVKNSYTVRIRSTDNGNPALAFEQSFTITINDRNGAPVAVNDPEAIYDAIFVGGQTTLFDLLANDTDADGDTLSIASINTTGTQGTVVNNGSNVSYTAPNGYGSSTFSYMATDGTSTSNSATATVTYVRNDARGDCNANGLVSAGDFIAGVLEIFDTDDEYNGNPAWWLTNTGSYAGSARGCDANAGENGAAHTADSITIADITCIVLIFFGDGSCTQPTVQRAANMSTATLSVSSPPTVQAGQPITVEIRLETAGNSVAAAGFALALDSSRLSVDPTDSDGDGVPDAVAINVPANMTKSVRWNSTLSRLEVAIFGTAMPLPTLSDGTLATITLAVAADANGTVPLDLQLASLGNTNGDDVVVNGQDGSLHIDGTVNRIFLPTVLR